jgi:dihydropteroate synthase
MILRAREREVHFPRRPLIMGIVNINDDSFCGDGTLDPSAALEQASQQIRDGADVIDIGAESARTNRGPISEDEEVARLLPFIHAWDGLVAEGHLQQRDDLQVWPPLLSINTWRSGVIARVLPTGGDLINDISALPTAQNAALCAQYGAALLIMHSVGEPKVPHTHVGYADVMGELERFFTEKLELAQTAGLSRERILLDPGIDFAKQRDDNLTIYRELERLQVFGCPILLPISRKTVIGQVLDLPDPLERDAGTVACLVAGMTRGAHLFRVHAVRAAWQSVQMMHTLRAVD